jgi:hypothetical protein
VRCGSIREGVDRDNERVVVRCDYLEARRRERAQLHVRHTMQWCEGVWAPRESVRACGHGERVGGCVGSASVRVCGHRESVRVCGHRESAHMCMYAVRGVRAPSVQRKVCGQYVSSVRAILAH